jgi:phenylpyruvate tautomerase PptA (4-oxalocrotonate tautomerase family)
MIQDNFLHLVPDPYTIPVTVGEVEPDRWMARIAGGWWVGYGASRKKAIKVVVNNFNREWFSYGETPLEAVDAISKSIQGGDCDSN